jgi:hypothetical protein
MIDLHTANTSNGQRLAIRPEAAEQKQNGRDALRRRPSREKRKAYLR